MSSSLTTTPTGEVQVRKFPGLERLGADALYALARGAAERGLELDGLLTQMWIESGFKSDAKNPYSTASGLIQMIDASAKQFAGVSASQLRTMSPIEQVPGILAYYSIGRPLFGADFRILGYSRNPSLIGKPDSTVVYPAGGSIAKGHPGAQDTNGAITLGGIRREFARVQKRLEGAPLVTVKRPSSSGNKPPSSRGGGGGALGGLGALLLAYLLSKGL